MTYYNLTQSRDLLLRRCWLVTEGDAGRVVAVCYVETDAEDIREALNARIGNGRRVVADTARVVRFKR